MRLDINLASRPYEDARVFWLRWGSALGALSIVTVALLAITITGWFAARRDHRMIDSYRTEIAQRDRTRQQAEDFLNRPENRATRDESQFVNDLIERKSLSWTLVLEDLERVMPARVHLVSIHPEIDENNQLMLKLIVGGDSREKAIDLARRMEESHRFAQTYIETEHSEERSQAAASGDLVQFDIAGLYVPDLARPAAASKAENKAENSESSKEPKAPGSSKQPNKESKAPAPKKSSTPKTPKSSPGSKP
jgi:type IV pilus assembly protein PilN